MRKIFLAAGLFLSGWLACKATDTGYRMKIAYLNKATGEVQAKFVTMPEDLRITCRGNLDGLNNGDYAKINAKNGEIYLGKAKCYDFQWVK